MNLYSKGCVLFVRIVLLSFLRSRECATIQLSRLLAHDFILYETLNTGALTWISMRADVHMLHTNVKYGIRGTFYCPKSSEKCASYEQ